MIRYQEANPDTRQGLQKFVIPGLISRKWYHEISGDIMRYQIFAYPAIYHVISCDIRIDIRYHAISRQF